MGHLEPSLSLILIVKKRIDCQIIGSDKVYVDFTRILLTLDLPRLVIIGKSLNSIILKSFKFIIRKCTTVNRALSTMGEFV